MLTRISHRLLVLSGPVARLRRSRSRLSSEYIRNLITRVAMLAAALSPRAFAVPAGPNLVASILQATHPTPIDGADEVTAPLFLWAAGQGAVEHLVYLGSTAGDLQQVARLPGSEAFYYHWAGLVPGQGYAWRVDEVQSDGSAITGCVWSFTTLGLKASDPQPQDEAPYQPPEVTLGWTAGATAAAHRLYLGTDRTTIAMAGVTWPELRATLQAPQASYPLAGLVLDTTYSWRVDEVELDGTVHRGPVWSFTTIPEIVPSEPNLVAWWTLDEAAGQTAVDWSGHGHHGTIHGGRWVAGRRGSALQLDGVAAFIEAPGDDVPAGSSAFSVAAWIRPLALRQDQTIIAWGPETPNQGNRLELQGQWLCHRFVGNDYQVQVGDLTGQWIHVALVHTGFGSRVLYINGSPQEGLYVGSITPPNVTATAVGIGAIAGSIPNRFLDGLIDDVRLYNRPLDPQELVGMLRTDLLAAWNPQPADWAGIDIARAATLAWSPGDGAIAHEVYLGADSAAVDRATPSTAGVYKGRMTTSSCSLTQTLAADQTYFWRVDEIQPDGTSRRGFLWRFTVARYRVIDDFESYTDQSPNRLFETWWDGIGYTQPPPGRAGNGTGAVVGHGDAPYAEQITVHSGRQAMPFYFDNTQAPFYSVIERQFDTAQDWTIGAQATLTGYLRGDPTNLVLDSDRLFVELQDSSGRIAVVAWDTSNPTPLSQVVWTPWDIPVSTFANQGLSLGRIQRMRIGVGQAGQTPGGKGVVYIDDIRLYADQ